MTSIWCMRTLMQTEERRQGSNCGADGPVEGPPPRAPDGVQEEVLEVELRHRGANNCQFFYAQSGKRLHLDRQCCWMNNPKEVLLPSAATPFVAWCHRRAEAYLNKA